MDSIENPVVNLEVNARGTLDVLEEAWQSGIHRIVLASTSGAINGDMEPPVR